MLTEVYFESVRCFHTRQRIPLRPITILVGENSSGKSSFLALVRIAWDLLRGRSQIDFNEEPFLLGAFDQIASYRGGRAGRARSFKIGAVVRLPRTKSAHRRRLRSDHATVEGLFVDRGGHPILKDWTLDCGDFQLSLLLADEPEELGQVDLHVRTPSGEGFLREMPLADSVQQLRQLSSFLSFALTDLTGSETSVSAEDAETLTYLLRVLDRVRGSRPYAIAPIRMRPQRTYDPLRDDPQPEGGHVPMVLAKLQSGNPEKWREIRKAIDELATAAGLFTDVGVRRLGTRKESDPFQIQVKTGGPPFNLVDVGYGVSQFLPIAVEILRMPRRTTFLLQQPEIHLHPRAQAELGSFMAVLAKSDQKRFVIETHSDSIVDRIRMDIRDSDRIKHDDVSLLWFERGEAEVSIRVIEIDDSGNIRNVPQGYRDFFLLEERRMLGAR